MRTTNIQAITYDAAGTLIHLAEPVGVSYSTVAARHGISSAPERLVNEGALAHVTEDQVIGEETKAPVGGPFGHEHLIVTLE